LTVPDVILALLRIIFLGLVYLFVWQVARAIGSHLGISVRRRRREGSRVVIIKSETQRGTEIEVPDVVVLGRSEEADVLLDDPYASEFHMRLVAQENGMVLHDLGSTNGTYVNGRRVTAPTNLRRGDNIQIGKTVMEVR
jgi:pSer/pThr/pTyr-binding forkhead associated (FHA) protein